MNIGDKVEVIRLEIDDGNTNLKIGDIGTVTYIDSDRVLGVNFGKEFINTAPINNFKDGSYCMFVDQLKVIKKKED